jgi:hypothetical protein
MRDLIVIMAGPSTSHALRQLQQMQVLNKVLDDENISDCSLDDDSVFDTDYTQLVAAGTHVIIDSESDNGSEE